METVKWLFEKTFSKPGWKHVATLCEQATKHSEWKATERALQLSQDKSVPAAFRKLYAAYSSNTIVTTPGTTVLKTIFLFEKKMEFFKEYKSCRKLLSSDDHKTSRPLIDFMASLNIRTSQGVTLISCLNKLVSRQLHID